MHWDSVGILIGVHFEIPAASFGGGKEATIQMRNPKPGSGFGAVLWISKLKVGIRYKK